MSYESRLEDATLLTRAFSIAKEMKDVEGFAYTDDSYTARIPGGVLKRWEKVVEELQFRLQAVIE